MPAAKSSLLSVLLFGCSGMFGEVGPARGGEAAPEAAEGFPDVVRWGRPLATIQDAEAGETRTVVRSPEGDLWAKVHHPPDQLEIVTRIDVRRRNARGEWTYESWDPARQTPIAMDPETCHLCHSMAPADGTWTPSP